MKTIKEYTFNVGTMRSNNIDTIKCDKVPTVKFEMPSTAKAISASYRGGDDIRLYMAIDRSPIVTRKFSVVRTGYDLEALKLDSSIFVATVYRNDGEEFHILEVV